MEASTTDQFLWLSADGARFFLIPAETVFHSGTFGLLSYDQEPMGVAEYSILDFEVSREKAQQHLMEEYRLKLEQAQKAQEVLAAFMENKLPSDAVENET